MPRPFGFCDDRGVADAPFYAMEHVDGVVLNRVDTAERLTPAERREGSANVASALAALHRSTSTPFCWTPTTSAARRALPAAMQRGRAVARLEDARAAAYRRATRTWIRRAHAEERAVLVHGDYH